MNMKDFVETMRAGIEAEKARIAAEYGQLLIRARSDYHAHLAACDVLFVWFSPIVGDEAAVPLCDRFGRWFANSHGQSQPIVAS